MNQDNKIADEQWSSIVARVRASLPTEVERHRMERYFPLMLTHEQVGGEYVIGVAEQIQVEMFTESYGKLIEEALQLDGHLDIPVRFVVIKQQATRPTPLPHPTYQQHFPASAPVVQHVSKGIPSTLPLHEHYTFENFVKGPSNSFAHAAATAVAKGPGRTSYNPLFIYGGTGLGKTHLMEAIGHYVLEKSPWSSVCYITSETFLNEYVNAIQNDAMTAFRERYRKVDVLLLDDVQFIAGKTQFQEEFFNTFNSLMGTHKQIVMTSDVAPKNLPSIEERLISRFEGGMVQEIESPSYETRLAIIKKKSESLEVKIPDSVLEFIADNIKSHVRAMEGALTRVSLTVSAEPKLILDNDTLGRLLKDYIEKEQTMRKLTIEEIQQACAKKYGVTIADILSHERIQTLVTPRQLAMYISRKLTSKGLQEIATAFGKKHATVINGVKTITERLSTESDLKVELEEILSSFGYRLADVID